MRIILITLMSLFLVNPLPAQTPTYDVLRIIPPSPTAAALAKYGDIPVSYYTGIPQVSIPVYTVRNRDITVPITLSYHAGGVRVEEEAGWVGLGWSLQAGGAITRTVKGSDDIPHGSGGWGYPDSYLPTSFNHSTGQYEEPATQAEKDKDGNWLNSLISGHEDSDPDAFVLNLNGRSEKFILNKRSNPSLPLTVSFISQTGLKVQGIQNATSHHYNWIVTDESGNNYHFGTTELSKSYMGSDTDEYMADQNTLDDLGKEVVTSWYLDKIVSATGALIQFNYVSTPLESNGTKRIISHGELKKHKLQSGGHTSCSFPAGVFQYLSTLTYNKDVYLKEIVFPDGKVEFLTSDREDIEPAPGNLIKYAQKLDELKVTAKGKIISRHQLLYSHFGSGSFKNKRLKLTAVKDITGITSMPPYEFTYDATDLPDKDSKSIDHWGYYNGAPNNSITSTNFGDVMVNGTILPPYVLPNGGSPIHFPGANRNTNASYVQAASLYKIKYPAGGETTFEFEPHTYYNPRVDMDSIGHEIYLRRYGPMTGETNHTPESETINVPYATTLKFYNTVTCFSSSDPCVAFDEYSVDVARVQSVGSTPAMDRWLTHLIPASEQYGKSFEEEIYLPAGQYKITVQTTDAWFFQVLASYREPVARPRDSSLCGGLRIKKMITYDGINHSNDKVTSYDYTVVRNGKPSASGVLMTPLGYNREVNEEIVCQVATIPGWARYMVRNSSPLMPFSHAAAGNPVGYSKVTETRAQQGKTEYEYHNNPDDHILLFIPNVPTIPDLMNGQLLTKRDFVLTDAQDFRVVKEVINAYALDGTKKREIWGMVVPDNVLMNILTTIGYLTTYQIKNVHFYKINSQFYRQTESRETLYNPDGVTGITTVSTFNYDHPDPVRLQMTEKNITNSRGQVEKFQYKYSYDFPSDPNMVKAANRNIIKPVVQETSFIGGIQTKLVKLNYETWPGDLVLPIRTDVKIGGGPLESRLQFHNYTASGQLSSQSKTNDARLSYLWGYHDQYPIAEISNATPSEVYYQSFEGDTDGGVLQAGAKSGEKVKTGSFTVNFTRPNQREYVLNYWFRATAGGKWQYHEVPYTGSSYVISNGVAVDEIRVHPKDASMRTFSYLYAIGITSETDASGKSTYYEYDDYFRLKLIRDTDFNVLKVYDHKYQQQLP